MLRLLRMSRPFVLGQAWSGTVKRRWPVALTVGLLSWPAAAADPPSQTRSPSQGIDRLTHELAGGGDASSLELNPALLNSVPGFDVVVMGYQPLDDFARGAGGGFFASINSGLGLAIGLGLQVLRPRFQDDIYDHAAAENPPATKLSLGIASGEARIASFGLAVSGLRLSGRWLRPPDMDLGVLIRGGDYVGVGANLRLAPVSGDLRGLPGSMELAGELAVRPLGTRQLELAGGVYGSRAYDINGEPAGLGFEDLLARARLAARFAGWGLYGQVEQENVQVLDEASLEPVGITERGWRGSVGLSLAWDGIGIATGVHTGRSGGIDGVGWQARLSSARQGRLVWTRLVDAERVPLVALSSARGTIALLEQVRRAREAGPKAILVLQEGAPSGEWASAQELRRELVKARNAGVHIYAYLEYPDLADYYLASAAEQIYLHRTGELNTTGLASTGLYLAEALDRLGVRVEAFFRAEYKSGPEQFTRADRSERDREQRGEFMDHLWSTLIYATAQGRQQDLATMEAHFDQAPLGAEEARELGLVDELIYRDELLDRISDRLEARVNWSRFGETAPEPTRWSSDPYWGVLVVDGTITAGESIEFPLLGIQTSGAATIIALLKDMRSDPNCRGIVLRVDSPGGDAHASELIWREVQRTAQAYKKSPRTNPPIVISMADYAASGGYYISMGGPETPIFALPNTLTGSIGVYALTFDVSGLLAKLGIATDTIKRGQSSDIQSFYKPLDDHERERMEASIQRNYELFVTRVSDSRKMQFDAAEKLARGRVWSGKAALEKRLVDEDGGLYAAIEYLEEKAKLSFNEDPRLRVLPVQPTLWDLVLDGAGQLTRDIHAALQTRKADRQEQSGLGPLLTLAKRLPLSLLFLESGKTLAMSQWWLGE